MNRDGCHVIRLRGPWRYEILTPRGETAGGPLSGRTTFAADWRATLNVAGRAHVRFRRSFHRPTGLEPEMTVWVVFDGVHVQAAVRLNAARLGELSASVPSEEFDVTARLEDRNELLVDAELPPIDAKDIGPDRESIGPMGEVLLEIRGHGV